MWPCVRLGPFPTSAHPASPPACRRWVWVKKGLGEAQQHRSGQPLGPERSLTCQHACDDLAWGSSYQAAELHCSLRALSSELSPFVGVLLSPPQCLCISHWLTTSEGQPQSHQKDLRWPQGERFKVSPTADTCLGVPNEGNANGELALHATGERLGQRVALVLQVEDPQDVVDLLRALGG